MTTIAEDLVLLLLDPDTGRSVVDTTSLNRAIGGALLLDLAAGGRVRVDGARLTAIGAEPTGDVLLDGALARLGDGSFKPQRAVERLARKTREPVLERLADRGLVRRERSRALGLFPVTAWPALDSSAALVLRDRVAAVLRDGAEPDERLTCLISLVHAVRAEHRIVDGPRRELRARAGEVAAGDWAGPAVRKAVQSVQAAVAAAMAASAASGAGGS